MNRPETKHDPYVHLGLTELDVVIIRNALELARGPRDEEIIGPVRQRTNYLLSLFEYAVKEGFK